jgi:hypothetical protein
MTKYIISSIYAVSLTFFILYEAGDFTRHHFLWLCLISLTIAIVSTILKTIKSL